MGHRRLPTVGFGTSPDAPRSMRNPWYTPSEGVFLQGIL